VNPVAGDDGRASRAPHRETAGGEVVVDARGLRCPAPIVALARAARGLPPGTRVTVLATDPAAATDVPAWARMRGHLHLATVRSEDDVLHLSVELRAPTPAQA
jgi:tRNA 2-thiouridine synthesizing protein A